MTIFLLSEYYFGSRKKLIYLFPPMILVWANSHPTYLMAFGLCGAFFADALVRAAWRKEAQWARLRTWVLPPLAHGRRGPRPLRIEPARIQLAACSAPHDLPGDGREYRQ